MEFWKMNGAGNDFIIINNIEEKLPYEQFPDIAATLCERHMSIGADGIMVVDRADSDADFKMTYYNSDGSLGEMCGNGARCICRYGYEMGLSGETQKVQVTAGIVTGQRISEQLYKVRLNDPSVIELDYPIEIDGKTYECSYVELGNPGLPHTVVPISGLKDYPNDDLYDIGRKMRYYHKFAKGANINFYEIVGEDMIIEKTYERGVEDFTYACGTGTGSVVMTLALKGKVNRGKDVNVIVAGGKLKVTVDICGEHVKNIYLTGPTNIVAKGQITDDNLSL